VLKEHLAETSEDVPLIVVHGSHSYMHTDNGEPDWDAINDIDITIYVKDTTKLNIKAEEIKSYALRQLSAAGVSINPDYLCLDVAAKKDLFAPYLSTPSTFTNYNPAMLCFGDINELNHILNEAGIEKIIDNTRWKCQSLLAEVKAGMKSTISINKSIKLLKCLYQVAYFRGNGKDFRWLLAKYRDMRKQSRMPNLFNKEKFNGYLEKAIKELDTDNVLDRDLHATITATLAADLSAPPLRPGSGQAAPPAQPAVTPPHRTTAGEPPAAPAVKAEAVTEAGTTVHDIKYVIGNAIEPLKQMQPGKVYSLQSDTGETISGLKEAFLRKRTAQEILRSGLASGCGDYALVFYKEMERLGYKVNLVEGIELSICGIQSAFSGHVVVEVIDKTTKKSMLVDPTALKILSEDWDNASKFFTTKAGDMPSGRRFWIFFRGSAENYRKEIMDEDTLRSAYGKAISSIDPNVAFESLIRIKFSIDTDSFEKATELRSRAERLISRYESMLHQVSVALNMEPERIVHIRIVLDPEAEHSSFANGILRVCRDSAMSDSLIGFTERLAMVE
jgi:hypothetical protein